jgi:hypothetical protein
MLGSCRYLGLPCISPLSFLKLTVRYFVASRYRSASAALSPPTLSSSASILTTILGPVRMMLQRGQRLNQPTTPLVNGEV